MENNLETFVIVCVNTASNSRRSIVCKNCYLSFDMRVSELKT